MELQRRTSSEQSACRGMLLVDWWYEDLGRRGCYYCGANAEDGIFLSCLRQLNLPARYHLSSANRRRTGCVGRTSYPIPYKRDAQQAGRPQQPQ